MSNLPPGVSESDIPGNRPEDMEYEAKWMELEKFWMRNEMLRKSPLSDIFDEEWFVRAVDIAMEFAYNEGWTDHREEMKMEAMEAEYRDHD